MLIELNNDQVKVYATASNPDHHNIPHGFGVIPEHRCQFKLDRFHADLKWRMYMRLDIMTLLEGLEWYTEYRYDIYMSSQERDNNHVSLNVSGSTDDLLLLKLSWNS